MTDYQQLHDRIPLLRDGFRLEKIHKGYSSDEKYVCYSRDGLPVYILRTYMITQDKRKRSEFAVIRRMEEQEVLCSRAVDIGVFPELELGYMLLTYIEGEDATDVLPLLTEEEQYAIGHQAGRELHKIHQVVGPEELVPWEEMMGAKHQRYRDSYAQCGVTIRHDDKLLSFIDSRLHAMKGRPNRFQHDDYHVGNLILKDGRLSGVIDFNRFDWGDPVHEFVKTGLFSAGVSVPFSVGLIRGYHDGKEPDESFWELYALYLAMTLVSSIVWILRVKPEETAEMMEKVHKVMEDHREYESLVPSWYSSYQATY